ncbi:unnamed protein product, partial [Urochloa humidicola]
DQPDHAPRARGGGALGAAALREGGRARVLKGRGDAGLDGRARVLKRKRRASACMGVAGRARLQIRVSRGTRKASARLGHGSAGPSRGSATRGERAVPPAA